MISSKEFVRRVRELPNQPKPAAEITELTAAYTALVSAAKTKAGVRLPSDPQTVMLDRLRAATKAGPQADAALAVAATLYATAANVNALTSSREKLAKKAEEAVAATLKKTDRATTTGQALKTILAAWASAGTTPLVRLQNAIDVQLAQQPGASPQPSNPGPSPWGTFRVVLKGAASKKQVDAFAKQQMLAPHSRLLAGALHPALLKEGV